ncbi:ABC transporter substrate-binding protein [Corynebacterium durum]|jgi:hypothetical protein|uniref:ABC transporter substrate-binding protein n=1 Tax=Corynebacterium durum TaxID=61592 RepID=UPI004029A100
MSASILTNKVRHRPWSGGRKAAAIVGAIVACATSLVACSSGNDRDIDHFGYGLSTPLFTTNAGTNVGASTQADLLAGRLYPPVFVVGPSGQLIPNRDLATAKTIPGEPQRVEYAISENAKYSDGAPVTCNDFLLAFRAGSMPELFNSRIPLMEQVENLECTPGSKQFTVVFKRDMGARWRYLFGPGTVLPSHVIASKTGKNEQQLVDELHEGDADTLRPIAQVWSDGFNLGSFDAQLQVSAGPFKIADVGEDGHVTLTPNEQYVGDQPALSKVTLWPKGTDLSAKAADKSIEVADLVGEADVPWVDRNNSKNPFNISNAVGDLNEQLVLAKAGVLASPEARQAFAACIDIAAVAEESARASGVDVKPMGTRLTTADDPINQQTEHIGAAHLGVDIPRAEMLRGQTIRVGYIAPNSRKAAMVEKMRASCQPAGVNVVDASGDAGTIQDLAVDRKQDNGTTQFDPRKLDAVLVAMDPNSQFGDVNATSGDVEALRQAEERLWVDVPTIPLAAQPHTFVVDRTITNVVVNTSLSGIGWNMDRWQESRKK